MGTTASGTFVFPRPDWQRLACMAGSGPIVLKTRRGLLEAGFQVTILRPLAGAPLLCDRLAGTSNIAQKIGGGSFFNTIGPTGDRPFPRSISWKADSPSATPLPERSQSRVTIG